MTGVTLHPNERDIVKGEEAHELFPKIGIQNGFAVRFLPPLLFPRINPALRDRIGKLFRIRCQRHAARLLKRGKRLYRCGKLHSVVCSCGFTAAYLHLAPAVDEYRTPSAGAGIPSA